MDLRQEPPRAFVLLSPARRNWNRCRIEGSSKVRKRNQVSDKNILIIVRLGGERGPAKLGSFHRGARTGDKN